MLFLYTLLNNTVIACGITGGVAVLLSFINRNMIEMRQDPFKPLDILLGSEFLGIYQSIDSQLILTATLGAVFFLLFFAACLFFIRNKRMNLIVRILSTVIVAAVSIWFNGAILSNSDLYESFEVVGNSFNLTDNFESKGFIYSFLYTMNTSRIVAPPNFDRDRALITSRINSFPTADVSDAVMPNIIFVQSEAFSDIVISPSINFDNHVDPLENFKRLLEDSISGHIVVPKFGGGTACTEFDILTGLSTRHFRETPFSFSLITRPVRAIPALLSEIGYYNLAMHPGHGWFYNRQNVYPYLGFDEFQDIETFDETRNKGVYISEEHTMERIIEEYENHMRTRPDTPLFKFAITIQNHGPYGDQYGAEKNFNSNIDFPEGLVSGFSNYIEGLADGDRELGVLTDFLYDRPEPVIVVFFGDHMPSFPVELFNVLEPPTAPYYSFEGITRLFQTPFLIWSNKAARTMVPLEHPGGDSDLVISASHLAVNLLGMLGLDELDPFVSFVNELSKTYPVILDYFALTSDGDFIQLSETPSSEIDFYHSWQYYWIFN